MEKSSPSLWFDPLLVHRFLPCGVSGDWSVVRYVVSGSLNTWLAAGMTVEAGSSPPERTFTRLLKSGNTDVVMSDEVHELNQHRQIVKEARGSVLLLGLGIGLLPSWLALEGRVKEIDILEKEPDVVNLVWPHLQSECPNVRLIRGDAYEWLPERKYDFIWHDLWPWPDGLLPEMLRRFAPFSEQQFVFGAPPPK